MVIFDLGAAIQSFRAGAANKSADDALHLEHWGDDDWRTLFNHTTTRRVPAGHELIEQGEPDRMLYFVLSGLMEVIIRQGDGHGVGSMSREGAGTCLGEVSFFDGLARSASVWAIDDCHVAAMTPEQYAAFSQSHPALASDLLFALARVLAARLRRTSMMATRKAPAIKALDPFLR